MTTPALFIASLALTWIFCSIDTPVSRIIGLDFACATWYTGYNLYQYLAS